MPAKQVIQDSHLDVKVAVLSPETSHTRKKKIILSPQDLRRDSGRCVELRSNLPSERAKDAFLSIVRAPKKLSNSIKWRKHTVWDVFWKSQSVSRRLSYVMPKYFCIKASCDWPGRPFINSLLLFQIVNSCASYYPSSCGYSPLLDEAGKKGKKGSRRWVLESFYFSAQLAAHAWGAKVELQSNVKQWRRYGGSVHSACASLFRYVQLGHANRGRKKFDTSTWVSMGRS